MTGISASILTELVSSFSYFQIFEDCKLILYRNLARDRDPFNIDDPKALTGVLPEVITGDVNIIDTSNRITPEVRINFTDSTGKSKVFLHTYVSF